MLQALWLDLLPQEALSGGPRESVGVAGSVFCLFLAAVLLIGQSFGEVRSRGPSAWLSCLWLVRLRKSSLCAMWRPSAATLW